jgi:hypothetical protein
MSRSVIVLSSQRSGSTALAEALVSGTRMRLMFEPLRGEAVGVSRRLRRGQFVDPSRPHPDLDRVLERVLSGRVRNLWVDRGNTCRIPDGRVIKDCLGTNLAPYLAQRFPEVPIVYLLRHPIATAHSVRSLGWPDELDVVLGQRELVESHFSAQVTLIEEVATRARGTVMSLVCRWCLENVVPLRLLQPDQCHVVFYEHLVRDPASELERLRAYLAERSPKLWAVWRPDAVLLQRPSWATWRHRGSTPTHEDRLTGWQREVDDTTQARCLDLVRGFHLDWLYDSSATPLPAPDQVLGHSDGAADQPEDAASQGVDDPVISLSGFSRDPSL